MRGSVVLAGLLGVCGCSEFAQFSGLPAGHELRCDALNEGVRDCLGEGFGPIECTDVSDRDLEAMIVGLEAGGCSLLGGMIPHDADAKSVACRVFGDDCREPFNPAPEFRPTRYPMVLVNGIDVSPAFRYSDRIVATMREAGGHDVHLAIVPPYETPPVRAAALWMRIEEILRDTGAAKVNLVCHSLGGLDCRYLASPGGLHWDVEVPHEEIVGRVASITTVSTAHRGTRAADVALGYLPNASRAGGIDAFATLLGDWFTDDALEDVHLRDSIASLSTTAAAAFNLEITDATGIYYQSWAGFSRPYGAASREHDERLVEDCRADAENEDGLRLWSGDHDYMALSLIPLSDIVGNAGLDEGEAELVPNDGLCSVPSARWGNFRGCVPVDHAEQLGQRDLPDANVRNGFDVARFYAEMAADLSRRGF